jgi:hypothetical protein
MRRLLVGLVVVLSLSLITAQISVAAVTPGTKCSKAGATSTYNGKKYTCVKSGKKLVWNKGVVVLKPTSVATPTPSATPTQTVAPTPILTPTPIPSATPTFQGFTNRCQQDPEVPADWKELQEFAIKYNVCSSPWRFVQSSNNYGSPQQPVTNSSELLPISQCKINDPGAYGRTFPRAQDFLNPTKSMNVLVIGASFPDYPEKKTPKEEYGKYFQFTQDFLKNISDVPVNPVYKIAEHYIQLSKPISAYNLLEHQGSKEVFKAELISLVNGKFDFAGVDQILIVMPAHIPLTVADAAMSWNGKWNIDGKSFSSVYLQGPAYLGPKEGNLWTFDPWITVHEQIGHQLGLGDHYGSEEIQYNRPNGPIPNSPDDWGAGNWGNMSGAIGDFIGWDKWVSGFLSDSQINCVPTNKTTFHWLRPSEIKNVATKGAVIPLSGTTGVFIESHRNTGYNYKQDSKTNGVLVYTIDVTRLEGNTKMRPFGYGVTVHKPTGRSAQSWANNMALGDATLQVGESITISGFKITVVESGDFGDVIKVEKV